LVPPMSTPTTTDPRLTLVRSPPPRATLALPPHANLRQALPALPGAREGARRRRPGGAARPHVRPDHGGPARPPVLAASRAGGQAQAAPAVPPPTLAPAPRARGRPPRAPAAHLVAARHRRPRLDLAHRRVPGGRAARLGRPGLLGAPRRRQ